MTRLGVQSLVGAALATVLLSGCGNGGAPAETMRVGGMDSSPGAAGEAKSASYVPPSGAAAAIFVDATAASGLDFVHRNGMKGDRWFPEMMGAGAALLDFDGDGDLDLFLVQSGSLDEAARGSEPGDRLYRNDLVGSPGGGALHFTDVTAASGIVESGYGMGVATGDYDGDGMVDLYVTNWGRNELWRNRGQGRFERRGAAAGVDDPHWSVAAVFFDAGSVLALQQSDTTVPLENQYALWSALQSQAVSAKRLLPRRVGWSGH